MAEEVYDGAIGIDLGEPSSTVRDPNSNILTNDQELPTLALPTTKAAMSKSVRPNLEQPMRLY